MQHLKSFTHTLVYCKENNAAKPAKAAVAMSKATLLWPLEVACIDPYGANA